MSPKDDGYSDTHQPPMTLKREEDELKVVSRTPTKAHSLSYMIYQKNDKSTIENNSISKPNVCHPKNMGIQTSTNFQ